MARLQDLLGVLSEDRVLRGRQFEHLCRWFLTTDPLYASQIRRIWLWNEWPGRWGRDAGIDLVAEARDGTLWAIQAKAYDPSYSIKKSDVDSFLSESARTIFSFRLLVATTNGLGRLAANAIDAQEKPVGCLMLHDLERAAVDWPQHLDELQPRRRPPKTPYPHNREAVEIVCHRFTSCDRGQLVMACGTGKTLVGLWVAEQLESERTLVLVPSLSLLAQTMRAWTANAARPFAHLAVCSDHTVAADDDFVEHTSDLGVPVTTDAEAIAAFLRPGDGGRVVFATYQSSPRLAEAFALGAPEFDLAIADEAHRCVGPASGDFATILDGNAIHAARRLFMTATPRFFTDRLRREGAAVDFELASMDDPKQFGPVFHRLGFAKAIEQKLLADYQVAVIGVDDATYRAWARCGQLVTTDGKTITDARTLAGEIGLAKAMRAWGLRRVISFHSRVAAARAFSGSMPQVIAWMPADERPSGRLWAQHVSGEMPSGRRDALLQYFRNLEGDERGLLSNARCLAEGVDVPSIDGVAFIDPRRSQVDIIQAIGRAIRRVEDKRVGTIVVPVFVGSTEDPASALDASTFKPVWEVIKALCAHDEELGEQLDQLRRERGRIGQVGRLPAKIKIDLPVTVGPSFARAFEARLVEQATASWEFMFGLLQRFIDREGHARVPARHSEGSSRLGGWVDKQRQLYAGGQLLAERAARLNGLPQWSWDQHQDLWEEGFASLQRYVAREGNALVPQNHVEDDGYRLGAWVAKQRQKQSSRSLAADRVARLEALPQWSWGAREDRWETRFRALERYVARTGDARVARGHYEDGVNLGSWVTNQRHDRAKGKLAEERIARLQRLPGWSWGLDEERWEHAFGLLQQYAAREGNAQVPSAHEEDGFKLGRWVVNQRQHHAKGEVRSDRVARLEAVGDWSWNTREDLWEERFVRLQRFVDRTGHARVPKRHVEDGVQLRAWVDDQREARSAGRLDNERAARLESLDGWSWNLREDRWESMLVALQHYVTREGHASPPKGHIEGGADLGAWVRNQRVAYTAGKLSSDRVAPLAAVPGWTWSQHHDQWEQAFTILQRFVQDQGHALVPSKFRENGLALGQWVVNQRQQFAKGKLSDERARRLMAVPGWTWNTRHK